MRSLALVVVFLPLFPGCRTPTASTSAPVEPHGDASLTVEDLMAHATELSSDAYFGRETLTEGADKTADYLNAAFASYGLQPIEGRSSMKVPYTLLRTGFEAEGTALSSGDEQFEVGSEFAPFDFSDPGSVDEVKLVFAGYGITAPEVGWDDYEGLDVKGKAVLVLRYTPNEKDESSPLTGSNHAYFRTKALNARKHGAVAMLLVTGPLHHPDADDLRLPARLRVPPPEPAEKPREAPTTAEKSASEEPTEPAPVLLALRVSQSTAGKLIEGGIDALKAAQVVLDDGTTAKDAAVITRGPVSVSVTSGPPDQEVTPENVIGVLPGSDPERRGELVVVGAHFDHLGGYHGEGDTVFNGADDNASGTAGLLELAQAFAAGPRPPRTLVFAGFSGEEKGLLGSRAMLAEAQIDPESVVFMLNLDMIGRNGDAPVRVTGDGYGTELRAITEAVHETVVPELPLSFGGTEYSGNSDHHPFWERDVPVMFFFSGLHEDYHQRSDHADKLDAARMLGIVRLGRGVLDEIASVRSTPRFVHYVFWLGAEVRLRGDGDAAEAYVAVVEADSRGARAGLRVGDVVVGFGSEDLAAARDVGAAFRALKPGTVTSMRVRRGEASAVVEVERARRGYLGVSPRGVSEEVREAAGLADDEGLLLSSVVDGGPAAEAGLQAGDILVRIQGVPVDRRSLGRTLARIGAGETVDVTVVRNGDRVTMALTLGERPRRR